MKPLSFTERILSAVLLCLVSGILVTGVWTIIKNRVSGNGDTGKSVLISYEESGLSMYTGIGRLRAKLKEDAEGIAPTVVISPVFPYDNNDKAFTEELAARIKDFRDITNKYISTLDKNARELSDDELLKKELLVRYNDKLRLGRVKTLYFTDFTLID